jgi:hypothetical protein
VWGTGDEVELTRVRGPEDCAPNSWYYITPTDPRTITLCPETCEAIHADTGSALIVDIGCAVPAVATVFTERYEAACSIEGAPQWSGLQWNAVVPDDGSRIQFRVRSAPTLDELDSAPFVDVATAMTSNQVCEDTCIADLYEPLAMPNNRYPFLELEITILPGTEADSPLLDTWELTFSCLADE